MEQFWQSAFAWFFRPLWFNSNHLWTLSPISSPPVNDEWPWHTISYSAKVRFQCQVSLHPLLIMMGQILTHEFLVQTWLDIDERPRGVLVPHASTWQRHLFRSSFQTLRATVQSLPQESSGKSEFHNTTLVHVITIFFKRIFWLHCGTMKKSKMQFVFWQLRWPRRIMAVKSFLFLADFVKAILVNLLIMTQLDARLVLKVFALYVFDGTLKRSPFSFFFSSYFS